MGHRGAGHGRWMNKKGERVWGTARVAPGVCAGCDCRWMNKKGERRRREGECARGRRGTREIERERGSNRKRVRDRYTDRQIASERASERARAGEGETQMAAGPGRLASPSPHQSRNAPRIPSVTPPSASRSRPVTDLTASQLHPPPRPPPVGVAMSPNPSGRGGRLRVC